MNGEYLPDTNIVIALFANDPIVTANIAKAEYVLIPAVVIGELFYGAKKSGRPERNSERIEEFASENIILHCDTDTARLYRRSQKQSSKERTSDSRK